MITYDPFWKTIKRKSLSTYALINRYGILPDTIQRLRDGRPITTKTIETLCEVIECNVQDIIQYLPENSISTYKNKKGQS